MIDLERDVIEFWFGRAIRSIVFNYRTTITRSVKETHLIGNNLRCLAADAVLIVIGTNLQAAFHGHQAALAEVVRYNFGLFTPGDDINEVSLTFARLAKKRPIHSDGEVGYGDSRLRVAQLRICD